MDETFNVIQLPSKGLLYQESNEISIRELKGKDEKLMAELNYENFDRKFVAILRNVLKGVDPIQLTVGDRLYVMLWLMINSISKTVSLKTGCEFCFNELNLEVDLSQLEVAELPDDYKEPYNITLNNGEDLQLRLFRINDEIKIADYEKSGNNSYLFRFATSIVDESKGIHDKIAYLENLQSKDIMKIRAFHEKFYHGPKMKTKYTCKHCGSDGVAACPFRLEYFFPYGEVLTGLIGDDI